MLPVADAVVDRGTRAPGRGRRPLGSGACSAGPRSPSPPRPPAQRSPPAPGSPPSCQTGAGVRMEKGRAVVIVNKYTRC